jgi:hypothetical protein
MSSAGSIASILSATNEVSSAIKKINSPIGKGFFELDVELAD